MNKNPVGFILAFLAGIVAIASYFLPVIYGGYQGERVTSSWFFPNGYEAGPVFDKPTLLLCGIPIALVLLFILFSAIGLKILTGISGILAAIAVGGEFFLFRFVIDDISFGNPVMTDMMQHGVKEGPSLIVMLVGGVALLFAAIFYLITTDRD